MKKNILFILLTILFAIPSFAQKKSHQEKKKEIIEFKTNFIADEMELKDDVRKKFIEVYTQMENERRAVFKQMKQIEKDIKNNKNATEADYDKATKETNQAKRKMADIEASYEKKFATFLTKKQIYKMKEAEEKFIKTMRECKEKKRSERKASQQ